MSRGASAIAVRPHEAGSATVLVTTLVGVLGIVAMTLGVLAGLLVGQRRTESAADLAALAGATAAARGADPCSAARTVAERNGASLGDCACADLVVTVRVTKRVGALAGRPVELHAEARAGPA